MDFNNLIMFGNGPVQRLMMQRELSKGVPFSSQILRREVPLYKIARKAEIPKSNFSVTQPITTSSIKVSNSLCTPCSLFSNVGKRTSTCNCHR